jgi:branched-chain amino acid transport system permease protein
MADVLAFLIAGLGVGAVYALLGLGIVTLYRTTGVLNFAFGAMGMIAAFGYASLTELGVAPGLAAALVVVLAAGGATLLELVLLRPFRSDDEVTKAVATIAVFVGLIGVTDLIWGTRPRAVPEFLPGWHAAVGGVVLPTSKIGALVLVVVIVVAMRVAFTRTRTGVAMLATADDRATAALVGVPVRRLGLVSWALTGALAAISILLIAPSQGLHSGTLSIFVIPGLAAAVVGELRSQGWTVVGGLALGVAESEAGLGDWTSRNALILPFVLLLAVLLWRQRRVAIPLMAPNGSRA